MTPHDRVWRLIDAARRMADPKDAVGIEARARLTETSGLSREGVELALSHHFETQPTASDVNALVSAARAPRALTTEQLTADPLTDQKPKRCHVVLAANVCTAPLRAIACAVAAFDEVLVKPSRRDPIVAELLVQLTDSPALTLASELAADDGDAVVVYGSDTTIASIRNTLSPGVTCVGHGTGFGIAVVEHGDAAVVDAAADLVARDLVAFDGQGCLSPRLVIARQPLAFAEALDRSLSAVGRQIPRGTLGGADRTAMAQTVRLFRTVGQAWSRSDHAVFADADPQAIVLAPPCRATIVVGPSAATPSVVGAVAHHVAALGGAGGAIMTALIALCPMARRSALGAMQRPPLDGPVDRRRG